MSGFEACVIPLTNSEDVGSQKCRISLTMLTIYPIGSYIQIDMQDESCICRVWPHHLCPEDTNILYDNTVSLQTTSVNITSDVCTLKPLKTSNVTSVTIVLVVKDIDKCLKWRNTPYIQDTLKEQCRNCLRKYCIVEKCTVDLKCSLLANAYGIVNAHVVSLSTKHQTIAGVVEDASEVIIEHVISEERHSLSKQTIDCEVGGVAHVANQLEDLLLLPITHADDFRQLGLPRPKGILLQGPPGCGKTSLIRHMTHRCQAVLVTINGPEVLSSNPGESEQNVQDIFNKAKQLSREGPCILFIDEVDSICGRQGKLESLTQVASAVMTCMDSLNESDPLVVIAATNRPSALDPSIRRPGRFDREVLLAVPNRSQRFQILSIHSRRLPLSDDVDLKLLADVTNGYVGADLACLCNEAAYCAMNDVLSTNKLKPPCVLMSHFTTALHCIVPSLQKGADGTVDLRPVNWDDIGGLAKVKDQLRQAVEWPMLHPEAFLRLGVPAPKGVLLYGPPGCCKTTLVRAAATATRTTFLSLSGAQLYSPFVGESERIISEVFHKARAMAPTILFLDEIDSIVGKRSEGKGNGGVQERILSTLLNEMDGIGTRLDDKIDSFDRPMVSEDQDIPPESNVSQFHLKTNKVLIVAATNRPDMVDEAILRPGRIDKIVYVPPPNEEERLAILHIHSGKMPLEEVNLAIIAAKTEFYTGADLENVCKEAAMCSLTEDLQSTSVRMGHFMKGLSIVKPSLSQQLIQKYKTLVKNYRNS